MRACKKNVQEDIAVRRRLYCHDWMLDSEKGEGKQSLICNTVCRFGYNDFQRRLVEERHASVLVKKRRGGLRYWERNEAFSKNMMMPPFFYGYHVSRYLILAAKIKRSTIHLYLDVLF